MKLPKNLHIEMGNYAAFAGAISLICLLLSLVAQKFLPPQIPIFYGAPEGEEQLSSSLAIFLPGAFSIFLLILNVGVSVVIKEDFIKKALVLASLVVSVFALVATLKIIFLVGSF